jgi:predicted DNA-binding antitoxin AbrB/MazE fold protein
MSETITAIYEGGVLRPLRPLRLPENARVQLHIVKPTGEPDTSRVVRTLLSTGRVRHLAAEPEKPGERQSPPMLPGPSLSEIIVAQRQSEI